MHGTTRVRLPVTAARRNALTFAKLLTRVDPAAATGFQFEGRILRPGSWVEESELPTPALVLECAGAARMGWGHRREPSRYLLWQYEKGAWRELARVEGESWEWTLELGPIAARALAAGRQVPTARALAQRLSGLLDTELARLDAPAAAQACALLHDQFAARMVAWPAA